MNYTNLGHIQYSKAIQYLELAKKFCDRDQQTVISAIIKVHQDVLNKMQLQSLVVINPTKTELGTVRSTFKKVVSAYYFTPIEKIVSATFTAKQPPEELYETDYDEWEKLEDVYDENKKIHYSKIEGLRNVLAKKVEATILPDFIISSKILLQRKTGNNSFSRNDVEEELNEHLNLLMLQEFQNQNKQFIKTNLNPKKYETSK